MKHGEVGVEGSHLRKIYHDRKKSTGGRKKLPHSFNAAGSHRIRAIRFFSDLTGQDRKDLAGLPHLRPARPTLLQVARIMRGEPAEVALQTTSVSRLLDARA